MLRRRLSIASAEPLILPIVAGYVTAELAAGRQLALFAFRLRSKLLAETEALLDAAQHDFGAGFCCPGTSLQLELVANAGPKRYHV